MKKKLIYDSRHQNLHMDRANEMSMHTVDISIDTNLSSSETPRLLYRYEHGYGYTPQFWGLWDVNYSIGNVKRRGYGLILHNTGGAMEASFYYAVDPIHVSLYFKFFNRFGSKPNPAGTKAEFTGYLFANGTNNQDYTV